MRIIIVSMFTALLLNACGGDNSSSASSSPATSAAFKSWTPLPRQTIDADTRKARLGLLNDDGTDTSTVKVWWYGVSSFVVAAGGHLFLLDAWEIVGAHSNYVPITRDDLVALKPEAIFIGHGHFDHAADAGYIASRTGAALIAGDSVCVTARKASTSAENALAFPCLKLGLEGDNPAGTVFTARVFADMAPVTIVKHTHSEADPTSLLEGELPLVYVPELLPFVLNLNTDFAETIKFLMSLPDDGGIGQPDGGSWLYHFRVGNFSWLWHDSTGAMPEQDPIAQAIRSAISTLPDCVDVQIGAIVGFGMLTSGYRDALSYIEAAKPKLFIPNHHDAWAPVIGGGAGSYEAQWTNSLKALTDAPEQDYLRDPEDYLKVRSFAVNDARWASGCR